MNQQQLKSPTNIHRLHPKVKALWDQHEYLGLVGGRGSAKSHDVATYIVDQMTRSRILILCCREIQDSIADSSKALLENKIESMGYAAFFYITDKEILCVPTGSRVIFKGLGHKVSKLQSLEAVDLTWIEEAHAVTDASLIVLFPTVLRRPGSRIIATWNPQTEKDPIDVRFKQLRKGGEDCVIIQKNYFENPNLPGVLLRQATFAKENNPDEFEWVWLGKAKPDDASLKIIPRAWLVKCVEAFKLWGDEVGDAVRHGGLDVAESPVGDSNCLVTRRGPILHSCDSWRPEPKVGPAPRSHRLAIEYGITRKYWDAGGVGATLHRDIARLMVIGERKPYSFKPFLFGGAVNGKENIYIKAGSSSITNGNYFARQNAQAWWNIRQRAMNTINRLDGKKIDLGRCLLINDTIPDLDILLDQLSAATYAENESSKITVNKYGDEDKSPDKADATVQAFASDIRKGLRA